MDKKELIEMKGVQFLSTPALRNKIEAFFKDGSIAFEHGFKEPTFSRNHITYKISYIDENGIMHCQMTESKRMCEKSVRSLLRSQILMLIKRINAYYNYCLTQA